MADTWTLTPRARADLADIWRYGAEEWSLPQADKYQSSLLGTFDLLGSHPKMARERREIGPGIRVHPHNEHLIFYRIVGDEIEVVRLAHGRSDWHAVLD